MPQNEKGSTTVEELEWKESKYLKKIRSIVASFEEVSETTEEQFNELKTNKNK